MSDKTRFQKADSYTTCKPGQWCKMEGRVYIRCPHDHGYAAMLTGHADKSRDWNIAADGKVTPSVSIVLPEDCKFHEFITLEGWTPEDAANAR